MSLRLDAYLPPGAGRGYEGDVWLQSVDFLRLYLVGRPQTGPPAGDD